MVLCQAAKAARYCSYDTHWDMTLQPGYHVAQEPTAMPLHSIDSAARQVVHVTSAVETHHVHTRFRQELLAVVLSPA